MFRMRSQSTQWFTPPPLSLPHLARLQPHCFSDMQQGSELTSRLRKSNSMSELETHTHNLTLDGKQDQLRTEYYSTTLPSDYAGYRSSTSPNSTTIPVDQCHSTAPRIDPRPSISSGIGHRWEGFEIWKVPRVAAAAVSILAARELDVCSVYVAKRVHRRCWSPVLLWAWAWPASRILLF